MKKLKLMILVLMLGLFFTIDIDGVRAEDTFTCKIENYIITYNTNGEIKKAQNSEGTESSKYLESYFKPTRSAECPTNQTAKIKVIDGGRTLYIAKIDETFGNTTVNASGCWSLTTEGTCEHDDKFSCVWDDEYQYCNTDSLKYVSCGDAYDIPYQAPEIISFAVTFLKVLTPVILVLVSVISLLKALAASKEDEIKKAQNSLVKKVIAAAMVFFVITIVQFVISKVAEDADQDGISKCMSCFLNNDCSDNIYYKSNLSGTYFCKYLNGNAFPCIEFED